MDTQPIRTCKKCQRVLPLDTFPVHTKRTGGRRHECQDCNRERVEAHHRVNKARRLARARERYRKDPSAYWTPERRARANDLAKKRNAILREQVYEQYGGKCACCGEDDPMFLTMDHVANNGQEMRKSVHGTGTAVYRWIIKNDFPSDFQILCMNCNFGKARNGGICPHQGRRNDYPERE